MILIGFIKEHNDLDEALAHKQIMENREYLYDEKLVKKVINYLDKGHLVLGWMGYFFDLKNENIIAPDSYFTDGKYVWPAYFPYYIRKYGHYPIDKFFLDYLKYKDFQIHSISSKKLKEMESKLASIL